jgi:AraC-like DNA-binding protein
VDEMRRGTPRGDLGLSGRVVGYWGFDVGPRRRLVVPDGLVKVMFGLGGSVRLIDSLSGRVLETSTSMATGLTDRAQISEHDHDLRGITVLMTPLTAYRVVRIPMAEWAHEAIPIETLVGPWARHFTELLAEAPDWAQRFALLDEALGARFHAGPYPHPEVAWAYQRLSDSHGTVRIDDLAAETGRSRRHLERLFRCGIGIAPKALAQVFRIQWSLAARAAGGTFADAAADAGFHDQPHFSRTFRAIVGCSPRDYLALQQRAAGIDPPQPGGLSGTLLVR